MSSFWQSPSGSIEESCDIVIIGSGPGGSIAALTLAEAGLDVLLLEKGQAMTAANMPKTIRHAVKDWYAEAAFRTSNGNTPCPVAGGEGLGGGTLVNSALCFSTPQRSLSHWNELSKGAFEDTESYYAVQQDVKALMRVAETPPWLLSGNDQAHKRGAQKLGWKEGNIHRNTPGCVGCSRCNLGCPSGGKHSTDKEILPRAVAAGARIFVGCLVEHIEETSQRVLLRGTIQNKGTELGIFTISAKTLVLSAGAIGTPTL